MTDNSWAAMLQATQELGSETPRSKYADARRQAESQGIDFPSDEELEDIKSTLLGTIRGLIYNECALFLQGFVSKDQPESVVQKLVLQGHLAVQTTSEIRIGNSTIFAEGILIRFSCIGIRSINGAALFVRTAEGWRIAEFRM